MKLSYKGLFLVVVTAMAAVYTGLVSARGPYARALHQVDSIWLDADACLAGLSNEAHKRGFAESRSPRTADAILEVNVHDRGDHIGASARYSAVLIGDDNRVLFSTSGSESSISERELCADIGDDIFDRIEDRRS